MLSVSNVSMRYGSKILFEEVSVSFVSGRRYGLTGPNGSGKSTFMKVLTGELDAQKGTIVRPRKFGVLRQDQRHLRRRRLHDRPPCRLPRHRSWIRLPRYGQHRHHRRLGPQYPRSQTD
jgi:ATPase subunit of ABC transporter with duplicated ATPase domains